VCECRRGISWAALFLAYAVVGALIAARRPANPIGWMFLCRGLFFEFTAFSLGYKKYERESGEISVDDEDARCALTMQAEHHPCPSGNAISQALSRRLLRYWEAIRVVRIRQAQSRDFSRGRFLRRWSRCRART
jgi:hypothetical protein